MKVQSQAKIVSLTAFTSPDYRDKCLSLGMAKVLTKPAKKKEVANTLN